ncbi:hypothetical protein L210DRAFT_950717, partial [Boletus edulis BED1]
MSSLTRFPDVALPSGVLTTKECTCTRKHSKYLVQTTENTRLPVGTVPQQALSGLPMPLTILCKVIRWHCPIWQLSFQVS